MKVLKYAINFVMDGLETIVFVGSIYIIVYLFLFQPGKVQGVSMEPTLHTNERFITDKVAYRFNSPQRRDIVVINSPIEPDIELIKRVIGLPGEKISFQNGDVYVNGEKLTEPYVSSKTFWYEENKNDDLKYTVKIPSNTIFVMGDNRDRSSDSRVFGPVPVSNIVGKADYRYAPLNKIGLLSP